MINQEKDNIKKSIQFIIEGNRSGEAKEDLLEGYLDRFFAGDIAGTEMDLLEAIEELGNDDKEQKNHGRNKEELKRVTRVLIRKEKVRYTNKYGRKIADALFKGVENGNLDDLDDIPHKLKVMLDNDGYDLRTGKKVQIPPDVKKMAAENMNEETNFSVPKLTDKIRDLIIDEYDAVNGYDEVIRKAEEDGKSDLAKALADIRDEEKVHIGELEKILKILDSSFEGALLDGEKEVTEELQESKNTESKFKAANTKLENYKKTLSDEQYEKEAKNPNSKLAKYYNGIEKQIPSLEEERLKKLKERIEKHTGKLNEADIEELTKLQKAAKDREEAALLRAKIAGEKTGDQVFNTKYEDEEDEALDDAEEARKEREALEKEKPDLHTHQSGQMTKDKKEKK